MYEEKLIRQITAKTGAIKRGSISPAEAGTGPLLNRLKDINLPMWEELMNNYKAAVESYNKNHSK